DVGNPGIGDVEIERLLGCPPEHLEFHLWYMKAKGWIARIENGTIAITVEGVDRADSELRRDTSTRLLSRD
ncbi:J domain-containing protein, partial [Mesorhizobium sp. M0478]